MESLPFQECISAGHDWEFYEAEAIDNSTVELRYSCNNCRHEMQDYMNKEEYDKQQTEYKERLSRRYNF